LAWQGDDLDLDLDLDLDASFPDYGHKASESAEDLAEMKRASDDLVLQDMKGGLKDV
jgi:hypothetical protein